MLTFTPDQDTIEVYSNIEFTYELETFGLEISGGGFTIDEMSWEVKSSFGRFTVRPEDYDPGYYTLVMEVYTGSGTGSLQDYLGAEGYVMYKEWVLLIDDGSVPQVEVIGKLVSNNYMQISWTGSSHHDFSYYLVERSTSSGTISWKITDVRKAVYLLFRINGSTDKQQTFHWS